MFREFVSSYVRGQTRGDLVCYAVRFPSVWHLILRCRLLVLMLIFLRRSNPFHALSSQNLCLHRRRSSNQDEEDTETTSRRRSNSDPSAVSSHGDLLMAIASPETGIGTPRSDDERERRDSRSSANASPKRGNQQPHRSGSAGNGSSVPSGSPKRPPNIRFSPPLQPCTYANGTVSTCEECGCWRCANSVELEESSDQLQIGNPGFQSPIASIRDILRWRDVAKDPSPRVRKKKMLEEQRKLAKKQKAERAREQGW